MLIVKKASLLTDADVDTLLGILKENRDCYKLSGEE
jgi:hypothetical protein